jgi:uncharacterized linocin/CFP29 family protein
MFPVYGGKCMSRKEVHNWVDKRGKRFVDDEEVEMEVRKVAEAAVQRLVFCGFQRTGKAM